MLYVSVLFRSVSTAFLATQFLLEDVVLGSIFYRKSDDAFYVNLRLTPDPPVAYFVHFLGVGCGRIDNVHRRSHSVNASVPRTLSE